jgi:RNA polymerase II elongation factor ELL
LQTLHFAGSSHNIKAAPETFRHELYRSSSVDNDQLYFSGRFSHRLEVKMAKDDTADADVSLAALKASLASYHNEKESKKAEVTDLLPPGVKVAPSGLKKTLLKMAKPKHLDLLKGNPRLNGTTRSMPASPALEASFKTVTSAPTSAPTSAQSPKLDALRVPLIHLLAIRPVSEKFLAQQTRSSKENCLAILQKSGRENRLDPSKWELSDRTYKELDVWSFKYPSEEDRKAAIENAISAFDRMRLSTDDMIWQRLLPKEERGKGKVLSRHDFRNGPLAGRNTPRINVQPADDGGNTTGTETDTGRGRLTPNAGEGMVRSRSQDTFKKTRVSEKEAMSKRLLSKNPLKAQQKIAERENREKEKKAKKAAPKVESKYKSAEFVEDSDEEDDVEMKDVPIEKCIEVKPKKVENPVKKQPAPVTFKKEGVKSEQTKDRMATQSKTSNHKKQLSSSSSISSPPNTSDSSKSSTKAERPTIQPPRPRTTSSPTKPSPLGSSPPANASDFGSRGKKFAGSSSSSSPPEKTFTKSDNTKDKKPRVNGVHVKSESNKRKADYLNDSVPLTNGHVKRHQSSSPSDVTSSEGNSPDSPASHEALLQKAQDFKVYWAKYNAELGKVSTSKTNVSPEQKAKLWEMHRRLEAIKKEIWDESGGR